jgi:hypothetical protein
VEGRVVACYNALYGIYKERLRAGVKIFFQKSRSHLKILGAETVKSSKLHTEDPKY